MENEVMRLAVHNQNNATEVVLLEKLGKNEVLYINKLGVFHCDSVSQGQYIINRGL
jgi:hypothetical protein